ncbi:MAG TPA: carboxypeptidase-like regulatory domain-containing protein [Acidobacteriaceae bacterium]|nr:carboxypeptidase-like regulatory domain-containing protein [Acidobacteriaceae bacterium]
MRFSQLKTAALALSLSAVAALVASTTCSVAFAQATTAAIHGTVTDPSGATVPGAKVTALDTATGITTTTTTNASGYYILPTLQVGGPYTVRISAAGFEDFSQTHLTLTVDNNREVDAKLKIGSTAQTVEVSATAVQVETSNTQLEQIVTSGQLEQIPLEGRDPAGLQKLEPGVVEASDRFGTFSSNGSETPQNSYMIDGIDINDPALENEAIQINPDALEEENIVTSTMNSEFSRNSGAVVNQVLKSGTNQLHGSGFEFYRDSFMTNGNYFTQALTPGGSTKQIFHQNLYGGTLGGPIFRNKLFFFLAYQGQRQRTAATDVQTTMDSDQMAGNFTTDLNYATEASNTAGLTSNPIPFNITTSAGTCTAGTAWNKCFPTGLPIDIPTAGWNPIAAKLISTYVLPANYGAPDANGEQDEANFDPLDTTANDQGIMRFDYTPSARDSISAATIFQSAPTTEALPFGGGSFPGFGETDANHYKLFTASWTHTFTSAMLNDLRASYFRDLFAAVSPQTVVAPSSLGFNITPQDPESGVPYIGVGNYFDLGFSFEGPQPRNDTNLTYLDNFTWISGNHALKFGANFEQFRVHNPFDVYNNGLYSFGGGGAYSSGDPLIDFALGIPDAYYQSNNGFINAVAEEEYAYGQDDWKVTPAFTLNYGVSLDVEKPYQNHQDGGLGIICWQNSSTVSTVFPGASPGLSWPGDPGCNSAGSPTTKYDHFAPRLGFDWSPSAGPSALIGTPGSHEFAIRAGFGLFYNRDQEEQSLQNLEDPPFVQLSYGAANVGGSPGFANPFEDVTGDAAVSTTNPFPIAPITPKSTINWTNFLEEDLAAFTPIYNVPYTYNYNLNIQRALGTHYVAQIGYVGSVSHRLASWYEGDPITSAGHAACLANPACDTNPYYDRSFPQYMTDTANYAGYPYYLSVAEQDTENDSNYNSFQASLIKAESHGLYFSLAYTYAHSLDDGSGYESATGAHNHVEISTPGFTHLNYGDSDFDARQTLHTSYVYTVPVAGFLRNNLIAREALSGWGLAGVTALESGFPVGITNGADHSLWCSQDSYFGCGDVPVYSGAAIQRENIRSATNQYFNPSPFSAEPWGTYGNTGRNFFHGPGFDYTNLSLLKDIHFTSDSARYIQLRLSAFNAFNHANFANPDGDFNSPQFSQVTSIYTSGDPNGDPSGGRAVQIAGKLYF